MKPLLTLTIAIATYLSVSETAVSAFTGPNPMTTSLETFTLGAVKSKSQDPGDHFIRRRQVMELFRTGVRADCKGECLSDSECGDGCFCWGDDHDGQECKPWSLLPE